MCCFRESAGPHLRQGVHTVTHGQIPLHTDSIYIGVSLPGEEGALRLWTTTGGSKTGDRWNALPGLPSSWVDVHDHHQERVETNPPWLGNLGIHWEKLGQGMPELQRHDRDHSVTCPPPPPLNFNPALIGVSLSQWNSLKLLMHFKFSPSTGQVKHQTVYMQVFAPLCPNVTSDS